MLLSVLIWLSCSINALAGSSKSTMLLLMMLALAQARQDVSMLYVAFNRDTVLGMQDRVAQACGQLGMATAATLSQGSLASKICCR